MELIVVKENQTVRGVKMSEQIRNIVYILVILFLGLFVWNSAFGKTITMDVDCLLYTSPSPRDRTRSRMPSSA